MKKSTWGAAREFDPQATPLESKIMANFADSRVIEELEAMAGGLRKTAQVVAAMDKSGALMAECCAGAIEDRIAEIRKEKSHEETQVGS